MRRRSVTILAMLAFAAVYFSLMHYMHTINQQHLQDNERLAAQDHLQILASELHKRLDGSEQLTNFMAGLLRINPQLAESELDKYGAFFLPKGEVNSYIIFARGDEVYYAYPHDGMGGDFIGYNMNEVNPDSDSVRHRMLQGGALFEGPYRMTSGRHMLFIRRGVVVEGKIWGYAVVGLDFDQLLKGCGLQDGKADYLYNVQLAELERGNVFYWGEHDVMGNEAVASRSFETQNMKWTVKAHRLVSEQDQRLLLLNNIFAAGLGLLLTVMVGMLVRNYYRQKEMAETDQLTGLLNRVAFTRETKKALLEKRGSRAFFLVDLNRFKQVNDVYGHLAGDALIIEAARRLQALVGSEGCVARIGGDEYTVLLREADQAKAEAFVAAARQAMVPKVPYGDVQLQLSISIGYVLAPEDGTELEQLYRKADQRMYADKERQHAAER